VQTVSVSVIPRGERTLCRPKDARRYPRVGVDACGPFRQRAFFPCLGGPCRPLRGISDALLRLLSSACGMRKPAKMRTFFEVSKRAATEFNANLASSDSVLAGEPLDVLVVRFRSRFGRTTLFDVVVRHLARSWLSSAALLAFSRLEVIKRANASHRNMMHNTCPSSDWAPCGSRRNVFEFGKR